MRDMIKQLFTGMDGETHDMGRWSWALSIFSVIGLGAWHMLESRTLDLMQFAQAIGVVVGVHAGGLWAKKDTEPTK